MPEFEPESDRNVAKLEALEQNFNMIQLKLFLDNSGTILSQARELNIPLHDCVVHFDLRYCPLTVEVIRYTERYVQPEQMKCFEETSSKENITCIFTTHFSTWGHFVTMESVQVLLCKDYFHMHSFQKSHKSRGFT